MDWVAPLIGLAGVLAGLTAAWASATRSTRISFNLSRVDRTEKFLVELLATADELYVVHGRAFDILDDFVRDQREKARAGEPHETYFSNPPEMAERITSATARWRASFSGHYLIADPEVAVEIGRYDKARASVVNAFNGGDLEGARSAYDSELTSAVELLKLATNITLARLNLVIARQLTGFITGRHDRRRAASHLDAALQRYADRVPAGHNLEAQPTESAPSGMP